MDLHFQFNHFSTIGRISGPAHYDVSIRQAAIEAFLASSFKIFWTQTFPRCGATCYILPSWAMPQLFNGLVFVYRSLEDYWTFCNYLRVLVRIRNFHNGGRINYTGDLPRYVLVRLFHNLTDKSYWNVDNRNNVDLLRIITRGSNSKCKLTIGVFSIAFAMSAIEKIGEFLNTLMMQYELRYKLWINAIVMSLSVPHCLWWLFYFQNIISFLFKKLNCAVEILIWSDPVDFLTNSLGMPYSVVTAQQACSIEMVLSSVSTRFSPCQHEQAASPEHHCLWADVPALHVCQRVDGDGERDVTGRDLSPLLPARNEGEKRPVNVAMIEGRKDGNIYFSMYICTTWF